MKHGWLQSIKRCFFPSSLRLQLLSRSLYILAVLLVLIGLFQYLLMREFIYLKEARSIQSEIISVPAEEWQRGNPGPPNDGFDRRTRLAIPNASIVFIDPNGNYSILSNQSNNETPPKLAVKDYQDTLLKKQGVNFQIYRHNNDSEQLLVLQPVHSRGRPIGVVQVSTSTKPLKDILLRQLAIFLVLSTIALLFGLLTFLPVIRRTLVPLSRLVDTVKQVNAGNLGERFPSQQNQLEIDHLAVSFNSMLERLSLSFAAEQEAREQMRRFIADASHELRTPLTSIHGFLEILLRGAVNQPEQLDKALKSMYGESERLNKLVQDLLQLAKLDRTPHIQLSPGDLENVIQDMEPQLRLLAGKRKVSFHINPEMRCIYDTDKMKQIILNLYHNAVQHTDSEKGEIVVSLSRPSDDLIQLSIQDNGIGIGEQHAPYIFDRFYRSDSSRTRKYGGSGLGLSITKSLVEAHGGTIQLDSSEGQGTTFHVWLPAMNERMIE